MKMKMLALPFRRCLRRRGQHQREDEKEEGTCGSSGDASSSRPFACVEDDKNALAYLHVCNVKPRSADVAGPLEAERCLLVTGVPRDVRAEAVQKCMSQLMEAAASGGKVERVVVNSSGTSCVVVFTQAASVRSVIDRAVRGEPPESARFPDASWGDGPVGLTKWLGEYRAGRRSLEEQQQRADELAASVAHRRAEREELAAQAAADAAGDGWTVVVHRKDKKKKVRDAGGTVSRGIRASTAASMATLERQRKKAEKEKQEKGLDDFYRFQRREKRRSEVLDLRARFAEDQKKLEDLRKKRRFKPV